MKMVMDTTTLLIHLTLTQRNMLIRTVMGTATIQTATTRTPAPPKQDYPIMTDSVAAMRIMMDGPTRLTLSQTEPASGTIPTAMGSVTTSPDSGVTIVAPTTGTHFETIPTDALMQTSTDGPIHKTSSPNNPANGTIPTAMDTVTNFPASKVTNARPLSVHQRLTALVVPTKTVMEPHLSDAFPSNPINILIPTETLRQQPICRCDPIGRLPQRGDALGRYRR